MTTAPTSVAWVGQPLLAAPSSIDGTTFRQVLSQLAAGVSVVTASDAHGAVYGLTATAVTSLSLDPPLVLVCISHRSRLAAVLEAGTPFIVHFLSADQEQIARQFARPGPAKFAGVAYRLSVRGSPQLAGTLASLECVSYDTYPGGDHTIVVGRAVGVQLGAPDAPLLYFRQQFLHLSQEGLAGAET
jgi:3-hydroxy-9,10-secoandrosta-1,3,5(10)-triene-9,17-dione monooxygenase reductase component